MAACLISLLAPILAASAQAQETRAGEIAKQQEEKAQNLRPYEPGRAEQFILRLEEFLVGQQSGWRPIYGSAYEGGGFTLGAAYQQFFGDHSLAMVRGLYSIKNYKLIEAAVSSPRQLGGRATLGGRIGFRDATQVGYYGLGMDTQPEDRANFRLRQFYAGGSVMVQSNPGWLLVGAVTYENNELLEGSGSAPSIETRFTPETAPGLGSNPAFVHTQGTLGYDWRFSPGYSRVGGFLGVNFHHFNDPTDTFSFSRLDAEAIQHAPIFNESWVISMRARAQTTVQDDDTVPYFLLPSLGSGSTLRAFSAWRFRDRHSLLGSAEWRWIPSPLALDMALFYDVGTMADRRSNLSIDDLERVWGIGARFHAPRVTPLRVELAHGREGWHLVFSGNAPF